MILALQDDLPFSGTERRLARALRQAGHQFVLQHRVYVEEFGRGILMDLAIPDLKYNLEVDGPHHWMPEQAAYDRRRDRLFSGDGWTIDRFPVYEIDADMPAVVREVDRRLATISR